MYDGEKSCKEHWEVTETNGLTKQDVDGATDADKLTDDLIFNLSVDDHNVTGPDNNDAHDKCIWDK